MKKKTFVTLREAESMASLKLGYKRFNWLQSGAEDDLTLDKTKEDLNKIMIIPRLLRKVKKIDIRKSFFGQKISSPIILSPMGHQTQFHKLGEIEMAKGIEQVNSYGFFGTQGRMKISDIRKNNKKMKLGWTIFPFGDFKWIKNQIQQAEKNKCTALVFCLDANIRSHRYLDRESRYDARTIGKRTNPISPDPNYALNYDWSLIRKVKKLTKLPIIIKGILTSFDANLAIKNKADGLWISNHGGRMFNSGISTIEALKDINKLKLKKYYSYCGWRNSNRK